ncbi:MAG TPA: ATP-binding cassette domain-containing protein [Treponemataceae bacterium]|jgi:ABC-type multidrug transport system ATPase subunit|nr:ATP-binding cassette domain-containing protein [Treponemataceae bacterium]
MIAPILELADVTFAAQGKVIVNGVSLAIEEGVATALVGPSGGGKSTVLKLVAGLLVPTRGAALYRGEDISLMGREHALSFRREAAFVFQDSALWANQSLLQILELPLKVHFPRMTAHERSIRIKEVISAVGYRKALDVRPAQLSMGEQKLIAFARAALCAPSILFLDEWTESLDETAARRLIALAKKERAAGRTVVFVSHNLKVIKEMAERVCLIVDGKLALSVSAEEFVNDESIARMMEKEIQS